MGNIIFCKKLIKTTLTYIHKMTILSNIINYNLSQLFLECFEIYINANMLENKKNLS